MELRNSSGQVIFRIDSNTGQNTVEAGKFINIGMDARSILNDPIFCAALLALPDALNVLQLKFNALMKAYVDQGFDIPCGLEEDYVRALEEESIGG